MKGSENLRRFNLIDEPWISVIVDEKGTSREVSLKEFFENAHNYKDLAGDTVTQDFAVLRVILAVLHTVFSRFDVKGKKYDYFELDEKYKQITEIDDEDDLDDYTQDLYETWVDLWNLGKFPPIVNEYLEMWHDRFYLLDDDYPFFQVKREDIGSDKINRDNPSSISGKNINRLISESGNKIAIFSPKYDANSNKEIITFSEIVRWLLTYQGYTGLSDKVIFGKEKYKASKGWLFDLGGIVLNENNLFYTLLLNCVLVHPEEQYIGFSQKPCWEFSSEEILKHQLSLAEPNNLAELYTNWARAIYIDPNLDVNKPFLFEVVKLPDLNHQNQFLEPMTIWRYNDSGENKDTLTPRKHRLNQSMWRSFGLIALSYDTEDDKGKKYSQRKPVIIDWLNDIVKYIDDLDISIRSISMEDDGNATSWVPVNEIFDELKINDLVLTDIEKAGWVPRIDEVVEETKSVIGKTYRKFISDIKEIRNISSGEFVNQRVEELYFIIDQPFREWLSDIDATDSKDEKIFEWREILKKLVDKQARNMLEQASPRDYTGISDGNKIKNIATIYNSFKYFLNKQLVIKEGNYERNAT